MGLISLRATFGCLDDATLSLAPGCNVLHLPNGAGKSTWTAFLMAMFYGVDSAERAKGGQLPVRKKYAPWTGKPMAGTVRLRHRGRELILQRTSEGGRPMAVFQAYDAQTGQAVEELTGVNCGQVLLGVERAVFERTALLRGGQLAVDEEAQLLRRLQNLAATGRESDSAQEAAQQLKAWKNRCRYHAGGLIPETEAAISDCRARLSQLEALERERAALTEKLRENEAAAQAQCSAAQAEAAQAARRAREAATAAADGPEEGELRRLLQALRAAQTVSPAPPPAAAGLQGDALEEKAREAVARLQKPLPAPAWQLPLGLALLTAGLALIFAGRILPGALLTAAGGAGVGWGLWALMRRKKEKRARQAILTHWQADSAEAISARAAQCRDDHRRAWAGEVLLEELRAYDPAVQNLADAEALLMGLAGRRETAAKAQAAQQEAEARRWQAEAQAAQSAQGLRLALAACSGRIEALGGSDGCRARLEELENRRAVLLRRERALALALQALEEAGKTLSASYGPRLQELTGRMLRALTGGEYDALTLEGGRLTAVRQAKTGLLRPLAALSRGTEDQLYLALRLALTELLLPPDVPLLLDDALLTFDEWRTAAALTCLSQTKRQVLLFTCRKLEDNL